MASPRATAIRRESALKRLHDTSLKLSAKLNIDPPDVYVRGRDSSRVEALTLDALAGWLATVEPMINQRKKKAPETDGVTNGTDSSADHESSTADG